MNREIEFVANAVKWFDKVNGNTYHSVNVTRTDTGEKIYCEWTYGYGEHYRQTALIAMLNAGWLKNIKRKGDNFPVGKVDYTADTVYAFERENNYPILWNVHDGLKREMIANGKEVQ